MWIKNLRLKNVQSYKDASITFAKGLNVIVGKNNTGKSTILRSLFQFQSGSNQKPNLLIRKFEKDGFIFATIVDNQFIPTGKPIDPTDDQALFVGLRHGNSLWAHLPQNTVVDDIPSLMPVLERNGNSMGFELFPDYEPNNAFIPFLAKRKTLYNHQSQFDDQSLKKIDADFRNLATKLNRSISNTLADKFQSACKDILNFVPRTLPGQQNMNQATIGQYISPEEFVTLDQMGDGVVQTIGLLVNLFQAKGKIFLIEEIENDLHPAALKKILNLIVDSSANNQFIVSTHSNIVMRVLGAAQDARIFETKSHLEENGDSKTELFSSDINLVNKSPGERIRVLNDLGYELIDSHLWASYLILEEPSAEHIILNFLIPHFTPKIVGRIRTIAAKGVDDTPARFHHLHSLFTYVHTSPVYSNKAWVLVDGDAAGKKVITKLQERFNRTWEPNHFRTFSKSDFEEFYPSKFKNEIDEINNEVNGITKGTLKLNLAKKIVSEYLGNPIDKAKEYEAYFKEVVDILKEIEVALNKVDES